MLLPNPYGDLKMDSEDRSTQKDTSSSAVTSSLSDLIARLEKAQGPDRCLDADIAVYRQREAVKAGGGLALSIHASMASPGLVEDSAGVWRSLHYTSSIDAAMTLVPKGMEKDFTDLYGVARVSVGINANPGPFYGTHEGGSLAIALCIAALKARSLPAI